MLAALSAIAADQAAPTETTMARCKQFLDYVASQEDAIITYHASGMVLAGHSNTSYLSEKEAWSRAGDTGSCQKIKSFPPIMDQCIISPMS